MVEYDSHNTLSVSRASGNMGPKRTGLMCPACRQPVAIIERETDDAITSPLAHSDRSAAGAACRGVQMRDIPISR